MSYEIHITKAAERDLINAADHIEFVLKNPKAAEDLLYEAGRLINKLVDFPDKFCTMDYSLLPLWDIRAVIVKNYFVIYAVDEQNDLINVIRFLHRKSDWNTIFKTENS